MHITLETDYAIRIVDCIARGGGRLGAKAISERACVTLRFSLKILRKLVSGGIVRSYKGAQGGFELAKPPEDISLNDIIEITEGTYMFNRCLRDGHVCNRMENSALCPYHQLFDRISNSVRQELAAISMAQMINKS